MDARRQQGLANAVEIKTSRSLREILLNNIFNPINVVLYVIAIAMIVVGDVRSALGTVGLVLLNAFVGAAQEVSAKRQLDKIALLSRIRVNVVRDGQEQTIDPEDIVLGDVLVVHTGDQIPVDGELLDGSKIEVDESALTGESDLVPKTGGSEVLSGSICVTGAGLVRATRVGEAGFANKLTQNARQFKLERTPLQREVNRFLRLLLLIVLNMAFLAVLTLLVIDVSLPLWLRALSVSREHHFGRDADADHAELLLGRDPHWAAGRPRAGDQCRRGTQQCHSVVQRQDGHPDHQQDPIPRGLSGRAWNVRPLESLAADFAASAATANKTTQALIVALPGSKRKVADEVPFVSARKWSALVFDDPPLKGVHVLGAAEMLYDQMALPDEAQRQIEKWSNEGLRVLVFGRNPDVMTLHDAVGAPTLPNLALVGILCFGDELRAASARDAGCVPP